MANVVVEPGGDGVAVVTLNRPEAMNSLTTEMALELGEVLTAVGRERAHRAVVLTGAGRGFCAGADMGDLSTLDDLSVQETLERGLPLMNLVGHLRSMPQPVIAAVNGPAVGVGFGLALAADIRLCAQSARFSPNFIRVGASGCEMGVSYLLPRIVGPTVAFEMMLTGRSFDAAEAAQRGVVVRAVPDGELIVAARELARTIAALSPFSVRMTKEVMWANLDAANLEGAMALETRTQTLCLRTADQREAITARLERRPAVFQNR